MKTIWKGFSILDAVKTKFCVLYLAHYCVKCFVNTPKCLHPPDSLFLNLQEANKEKDFNMLLEFLPIRCQGVNDAISFNPHNPVSGGYLPIVGEETGS